MFVCECCFCQGSSQSWPREPECRNLTNLGQFETGRVEMKGWGEATSSLRLVAPSPRRKHFQIKLYPKCMYVYNLQVWQCHHVARIC